MGIIITDVKNIYLPQYPDQENMLKPFLSGFDVTYAEKKAIPFVKMPVAGRYVAMELAKKENRKALYKVVDADKRRDWVTQRMKSIVRDIRQLETAIRSAGANKLFGENSFPEAEKFAAIIPVSSETSFETFFNICNRCFVESIENYGKSIGKGQYFWNEIKASYPILHAVLHRAKVYRHSQDHLALDPQVAQKYKQFWAEDTQGITDPAEQRFVIQQKFLESFLASIQIEIASIS